MLLLGNGPRFCVGGDVAVLRRRRRPRARSSGSSPHDWHEVIRRGPRLPGPRGRRRARRGRRGRRRPARRLRRRRLRPRRRRSGPAYGALGFSPDGGTSWALTRALGAPRALDLMLTNGSLTAAEAHLTGLVARLVEDDDLRDAADAARARDRRRPGPRDGAHPRRWSAARRPAPWRSSWTTRRGSIAESAADPEGREGVRAFVEKRAPDFRSAR